MIRILMMLFLILIICLTSSCVFTKTKYIVPHIEVSIPDSPKLNQDIKSSYNSQTHKIEYSVEDAAKTVANVTLLRAYVSSLRIRLEGVRDALNHLRQVENQ